MKFFSSSRRFSPVIPAALWTLAVIGLAGCHKPEFAAQRPAPDLVVFTYGNMTLTAKDLLIAFQESHAFPEVLAAPLGKEASDILHTIGEQLALEKSLAEKAREVRLQEQPAFLDYHRNVLRDELYQKLLIEEVWNKIHIGEPDLRRFYDENKSSLFLKKGTNVFVVRGLYILITAQRDREQARARAEEAYRKIKQGTPFEFVAIQYSDAPDTIRGKEMSISPGLANPEVEQRIRNLGKGEYTEPFYLKSETQRIDGYFIYQRVDFLVPEYSEFAQVRNIILVKMTSEQREKGIYFLSQTMQKKHKFQIVPTLLEPNGPSNPTALILTVPGVYELSLGEFEKMAAEQQKVTLSEKQEYLLFLTNKALFLAEAQNRSWTEKDVAPALAYWDQKRLAEEVIRSELAKQTVTENQIREFYEKNRQRPEFFTPKLYNLYHLFFRSDFDLSMNQPEVLANMKRAENLAKTAFLELALGRSFEDVIAQFAKQGSAAVRGEYLGKNPLGQFDVTLQPIVGPLEAGEISQPKEVFSHSRERYGYEVVYAQDVEPGRAMTYEEARNLIGTRIAKTLYDRLWNQWKQEFMQNHPLKISESAVGEIYQYLKTLALRPDLQGDISRYELPGAVKP